MKRILSLMLVLNVLLSIFGSVVFASNGQAGTTLSATVAGEGFSVKKVAYDWILKKSVDKETLIFQPNKSIDLLYTLQATRSLASETIENVVRGQVTVTNGGSRTTKGLKIVAFLENIEDATVTIIPSEQLLPGQTKSYPYEISLNGKSNSTYKVIAQVTITNHSGSLGTPKGPTPKQGGILIPVDTSLQTIDGTAVISDSSICPAGFNCTKSQSGPWTMNDSGTVEYKMTITNTGTTGLAESVLVNNAKLVEETTKEERTADKIVILTAANPEITLQKSASPSNYNTVGDVINYNYLVKNTGNVSLAGPISVEDNKVQVACPSIALAPGESVTCQAQYTITQADIDDGSVTNVATASANDVTSNQATLTVQAVQNKSLNLEKNASLATYSAVGEIINYNYVVTNTGNVSLAGPITVQDNQVQVTCPSSALSPGESVTCQAQYTINQADIDGGSVTNVATASANGITSNQATLTVNGIQNKSLNLQKTASFTTYSAVGEIINYNYVVTNTGNVSLAGQITVQDNKVQVSCPNSALAPGESVTCQAQYTITQADIDGGSVTNVATASANGVTSNQATQTVRYIPPADTVPPITKYHLDPIYCTSCQGQYIKGFTISLQVSDNQSGVKSTWYQIDGGAWTAYTKPFVIYAGVTHIVRYYSIDNAGNEEKPNIMDFDKGTFTGAGSY